MTYVSVSTVLTKTLVPYPFSKNKIYFDHRIYIIPPSLLCNTSCSFMWANDIISLIASMMMMYPPLVLEPNSDIFTLLKFGEMITTFLAMISSTQSVNLDGLVSLGQRFLPTHNPTCCKIQKIMKQYPLILDIPLPQMRNTHIIATYGKP